MYLLKHYLKNLDNFIPEFEGGKIDDDTERLLDAILYNDLAEIFNIGLDILR